MTCIKFTKQNDVNNERKKMQTVRLYNDEQNAPKPNNTEKNLNEEEYGIILKLGNSKD